MNTIEAMFNQENAVKFTNILRTALQQSSSSSTNLDPKLVILIGSGNNGKTYLMSHIEQAFPSKVMSLRSHMVLPSSSIITIDDFEERDELIKTLASKRIVYMELDGNRNIIGANLKELLSTRNTTQFILLCNQLPTINGVELSKLQDAGVLRRIEVIECSETSASNVKASDIKKAIESLCV